MMKIDPLIFGVSLNARPSREVRADTSADAASGSAPEQAVAPAAAAEGHAIAEERNGRWRGLDPAGLPPQWQGTVQQLWADMSRQASTRDGLACEPPSLSALSDETINRIARLLPDADIGRLSLVNRRLRDTLAEQRKARRLVRQALQSRDLPEDFRSDALCRIMNATDALPVQCRGGPLTAVAGAIHSLPQPTQRWLMFKRILTDTGGLTEQRVAPLEALARLVPHISTYYRRAAFNDVLAAVAGIEVQYRGTALATLLHNIRTLPWAGRRRVFDAILAAIEELAAQDRSTLLARLPLEIDHLLLPVWSHAFDAVLSAIARLAAPERAAPLMSAARRLSSLPEPERPDAFEQICGEIANIAEDERHPLLRLLQEEMWSLPETDRPQAFRQLLSQIHLLPEGNRYDAFIHALAAIKGLAVADGPIPASDLLTQLGHKLETLPKQRWIMARLLIQAAYMAPDVRQHYADPNWADRLAIVTDPEGTSVVVRCAMPDGTTESRQYWTGSAQFGEAGNRNVLLEPVDTDGARRWYLAGCNGERLSQYLERRYGGTLISDCAAPAPPADGNS